MGTDRNDRAARTSTRRAGHQRDRPPSGRRALALVVVVAGLGVVLGVFALVSPSPGGEPDDASIHAPQARRSSQASPVPPDTEPTVHQLPQPVTDDVLPVEGAVALVPDEEASAPEPAPPVYTALDRIAGSFLSGHPDVDSMNAALEQLALLARVDPESVEVDGIDGRVSGTLSLPGDDIRGTFEVQDGTYRVAFDARFAADDGEAGFVARDIVITFDDDRGLASRAGTVVQFHPDMASPSSLPAVDAGERIVGWAATVGADGTSAKPLTVSHLADQSAWRVGPSRTLASVSDPWNTNLAAHERWLQVLGPFARKP